MTGNLAGRGRAARRIAATGLAVLSLAVAGCDSSKSKQLIREGNAYFKEQLYEDALKKYEAAQALDPNEVRLDKFVAMGYMALYNPGSTHPKDIEALTRAIEHFKKYLAAKPDDEKAARFLVTTYMNAQKYDEAIKYFKELVEKHPRTRRRSRRSPCSTQSRATTKTPSCGRRNAARWNRTTPRSSTRWA